MIRFLIAAAVAVVCVVTAAVAQQGMSEDERAALAAAEQAPVIRDGLEGPWAIRVFDADGMRFGMLDIESVSEDAFAGALMSEPASETTLRRGDAAIVLNWTTGRTYVTDPGHYGVEDGARRTHVARFAGHRIDGESMDETGAVIARWYALRLEDESDAPQRFAGRAFELRPTGAPRGQCVDRYAFAANGGLTVTSGSEVLQTRWRVLPRTVGGMLVIERTMVSGNGAPDCGGRVSSAAVGDVRRLYVMFHNDGNASLCTPALRPNVMVECHASLARVP